MQEYVARVEEQISANGDPQSGFPTLCTRAEFQSSALENRIGFLDFEAVGAEIGLPGSQIHYCQQARWHLLNAAMKYGVKVRTPPADEMPEIANITASSLSRWLLPIDGLYAMCDVIGPDAVQLRPFPEGLWVVANTKGKGTVRTPTPSPRLALHLMEQAATWVVDRSAPLIAAYDKVADDCRKSKLSMGLTVSDIVSDDVLPFKVSIFHRQRGVDIALGTAIRYLIVACFIVIATFTARRHEEILDLRADCLRGNDHDGYFLEIYIEKTLQRKEWIPVPNLVAKAVEVLLAISRRAREAGENDLLFQYSSITSKNEWYFLFTVKAALNEFANFVEVPLPKQIGDAAPKPWHWTPHQFRRFFAILYYYRWSGASITVLAHHLRHFDPEMTRVYITRDPEVAAIWTDAEWGFTLATARAIVANRNTGGGMGKKLSAYAKRITDKMRQMVSVIDPRDVASRLKAIMQRSHIVLTPKPWVDCACPRSRSAAQRAQCRKGEELGKDVVGPDFSAANPTVCKDCPWALISSSKMQHYDGVSTELEFAVASSARAGTLFGNLEASNLVSLNEVREARAGRSGDVSLLDVTDEA
ncbi:tyrosine-type recombinase/integrase [Novosphingobium sp. TCA1]|uniref:tyrosine-type recombinase/integrase n=1 Tax=Novosphingobium sp. TCA1 TaxID=2682474 RepID=UPI001356B8DE|nr:tyrosine-type recombinase/integrase [Novosphingobium sp. TCA1]